MSSYIAANPQRDLEITYQIGKFIQSHVTTKVGGDDGGKPWANYPSHFSPGPDPSQYQTRKGLVLEYCFRAPSFIHTPYGRWSILGRTYGYCGDWNKVFESIKESLGLVLLKEEDQQCGALWAITKWGERKIELPEYKEQHEYIPYAKVKEAWNSSASRHFDLTQ